VRGGIARRLPLLAAAALLAACAADEAPRPRSAECDGLLANPAEAWILCIAPPVPALAGQPAFEEAGRRDASNRRP
jgi:hypothetical protein